jgi:hypothetical protein
MPRGDGTGPAGFGPMSGRGAGYCAGYPVPGYANPFPRGFRGRGRGFRFFGRGRGFYGRGRRFFAAPYWESMPYWAGAPYWARGAYPFEPAPDYYDDYNPDDEAKALSREAELLKKELKAIEERLSELEEKKEDLGKDRDED